MILQLAKVTYHSTPMRYWCFFYRWSSAARIWSIMNVLWPCFVWSYTFITFPCIRVGIINRWITSVSFWYRMINGTCSVKLKMIKHITQQGFYLLTFSLAIYWCPYTPSIKELSPPNITRNQSYPYIAISVSFRNNRYQVFSPNIQTYHQQAF